MSKPKYTPEKLVAVSRYQNYFPTLSAPIKKDVYSRIAELAEEEQQYCDKGNFKHMAQILTSIALYETLKNHGKSEEEAYRIVSEEMWKFLDPSGMQKLAKKSFFLPLMKRIGDAQIGTSVQLNDSSVWEVFIIHPANISRPILKNDKAEILDLMTRPDLEIVKNV